MIFAARAPVCCYFPTLCTFGILHELLKDVGAVELDYALHIFFERLVILREEVLHLISSNLVPIPVLHFEAKLRYLLNYKAVFRGNRVFLDQ